jgi:hypothetical protein
MSGNLLKRSTGSSQRSTPHQLGLTLSGISTALDLEEDLEILAARSQGGQADGA